MREWKRCDVRVIGRRVRVENVERMEMMIYYMSALSASILKGK